MPRGLTDPNDERRDFAARYASLEGTAAFAETFCERHGFARDTALKVALIVEELLCNAIEHGYGGECDDAIRISLCAEGRELILLYEDDAPPFDPFAGDIDSEPNDAPLESRPVGGLGLRLVRGFPADARYAREDGRNRLRITLRETDSSRP